VTQYFINGLIGFALICLLVVLSATAGYYSEIYKQDVRTDRCINAACDGTCNKHRFVRHQGCEAQK
jgi:hypothetical protein